MDYFLPRDLSLIFAIKFLTTGNATSASKSAYLISASISANFLLLSWFPPNSLDYGTEFFCKVL